MNRSALASALVAPLVFAAAFVGTGPGPAKVKAALAVKTGETAAAVFVTTNVPTAVVFYGTTAVNDPAGPPAGKPCSPVALAPEATTPYVIQAVGGTYRRCV